MPDLPPYDPSVFASEYWVEPDVSPGWMCISLGASQYTPLTETGDVVTTGGIDPQWVKDIGCHSLQIRHWPSGSAVGFIVATLFNCSLEELRSYIANEAPGFDTSDIQVWRMESIHQTPAPPPAISWDGWYSFDRLLSPGTQRGDVVCTDYVNPSDVVAVSSFFSIQRTWPGGIVGMGFIVDNWVDKTLTDIRLHYGAGVTAWRRMVATTVIAQGIPLYPSPLSYASFTAAGVLHAAAKKAKPVFNRIYGKPLPLP